MPDFDFIERLEGLLHQLNWRQIDLSLKTGIHESTISRWHKKGKRPKNDTLEKVAEATGCNLHWLATGHGEMFPETHSGKIAARIESGRAKKDQSGLEEEEAEVKPSISQLIQQTIAILESDTVYSRALQSNIEAFHEASQTEQQMKEMRIDMEQLKNDMQSMKRDMEELRRENNELKLKLKGENKGGHGMAANES